MKTPVRLRMKTSIDYNYPNGTYNPSFFTGVNMRHEIYESMIIELKTTKDVARFEDLRPLEAVFQLHTGIIL